MTRPKTEAISPFFIVSDVSRAIAFYRDKLGFELVHSEPEGNPFFAIVRRDGAQLFVKSGGNLVPLPNPKRDPSMRWDAFVHASDPDALAADFVQHGTAFSEPLADTHDGLRGDRPRWIRTLFRASAFVVFRRNNSRAHRRVAPWRLTPTMARRLTKKAFPARNVVS
ncbi:MAG: VOC family protein [Candidatus Acidiferrales bacterium]